MRMNYNFRSSIEAVFNNIAIQRERELAEKTRQMQGER